MTQTLLQTQYPTATLDKPASDFIELDDLRFVCHTLSASQELVGLSFGGRYAVASIVFGPAVDELGLKIIEGESGVDAWSARVTARDSSDKKVEVRLKAVTSKSTKLSVRVGTFGDDSKTQRIYSTIREHLKPAGETPAESSLASDWPRSTTE